MMKKDVRAERLKSQALRLARLDRPLTYTELHIVLRHQRGRATEHACQRCGKPARSWAYDHEDPDEMVEEIQGQRRAFSQDLNHYLPLCRSCHVRLDTRPTTRSKAIETDRSNRQRRMEAQRIDKEFLTISELAELLGVKVHTIYEWNSVGAGPAYYKIGRYVRYRKKDIEAWLATRRPAGPSTQAS